MPEIKAKAKLFKVTKGGKLRYGEIDDTGDFVGLGNAKVGTTYLSGDFFDGDKPEKIEITIKAEVVE